jgi:hypothetical protein
MDPVTATRISGILRVLEPRPAPVLVQQQGPLGGEDHLTPQQSLAENQNTGYNSLMSVQKASAFCLSRRWRHFGQITIVE